MEILSAYVSIIFIVFLVFPALLMFIKLCALCCNTHQRRNSIIGYNDNNVRQAPVYTIATDPRGGNDNISNFPDYFWDVSNRPAKDDKDLPSYDEVMRMEMERQVIGSQMQAPHTTSPTNTDGTSPQPIRLPV